MKNTLNTPRIATNPNSFVGIALLALCACASSEPKAAEPAPKPAPAAAPAAAPTATPRTGHAQITNEYTAKAQVLLVEAKERLLTLRREDGECFQIEAGPEVRNFDQIVVGDQLRVRYAERLKATLLPPNSTAPAAEGAVAAERAAAGAKPSGGLGYAVSVRVKIESIDRDHDLVVFSLATGELITHRIATPEGRRFVSSLKVGDAVMIDYAEALALSIEKV